jgi:hypothetical protein
MNMVYRESHEIYRYTKTLRFEEHVVNEYSGSEEQNLVPGAAATWEHDAETVRICEDILQGVRHLPNVSNLEKRNCTVCHRLTT